MPVSAVGGRIEDLAERPTRHEEPGVSHMRLCRSSTAHRHFRGLLGACPPGGRHHEALVFSQSWRSAHRSGLRYRSRSEEHTSELQSLMRISYAVFCLKKKT